MATANDTTTKPAESPTSKEIAAGGQNLAELLAAAGNGVRVTGLVLAVEEAREFRGTSGKGNAYAFAVQEMQVFTGNKTTICKFQQDIGLPFPPVVVGSVRTFKVKSVRMNGNEPTFEVFTDQ